MDHRTCKNLNLLLEQKAKQLHVRNNGGTYSPIQQARHQYKQNILAWQLGLAVREGNAPADLTPGTCEFLMGFAENLSEGILMVPAAQVENWDKMHELRRSLPSSYIFLDTSQTGSGKTSNHARQFIREQQQAGRTVVVVTLREKLACRFAEQSRGWPDIRPLRPYKGLSHAQQAQAAINTHGEYRGLSICVNSLPNIREACREHAGQVAFVFDEIGTTLTEQVIGGAAHAVHAIKDLIRDSDTPVLLMDATAGSIHRWIIEQLSGRRVEVARLKPQARPGGVVDVSPVTLVLAEKRGDRIRTLIEDCAQAVHEQWGKGRQCFVFVDSKESMGRLLDHLYWHGIPKGAIEGYADLSSLRQQKLLRSHHITSNVPASVPRKIRVAVFTQLVSIGTSFESTQGAYAAVLATSGHTPPDGIIQGLGRARGATEAGIWTVVNPLLANWPTDTLDHDSLVPCSVEQDPGRVLAIARSYLDNRGLVQSLMRVSLPLLLEHNGYTAGRIREPQAIRCEQSQLSGDDVQAHARDLLAYPTPTITREQLRKHHSQLPNEQVEKARFIGWLGRGNQTITSAELWARLPPAGRGTLLRSLGRGGSSTADGFVLCDTDSWAVTNLYKCLLRSMWENRLDACLRECRKAMSKPALQRHAVDLGLASPGLLDDKARHLPSNALGKLWLGRLGFSFPNPAWPDCLPSTGWPGGSQQLRQAA